MSAKPQSLLQQLAAARAASPQLSAAHAKVAWRERATSLWSPLLVFAIALAPYILLVELAPSTASWAQPTIKGFGLLMVLWFLAALVYRLAVAPARKLRRLRVETGEMLGQMDRELRRKSPDESTRLKIFTLASGLEAARLQEDPEAVEGALTKLTAAADKALPNWRKRGTVEGVKGLFWTLLAVLALRTLFVEPYRIPTGSMLPTLNLGDHVIVNRFIYGVRIPFVNVVLFPIVRRPEVGDVIVFNNPVDTSVDFIKRVAGVPGDTVELVEGVVFINGKEQPRRLVDPAFIVNNRYEGGNWFTEERVLFEEDLGGRPHAVLQDPARRPRARQGPFVVPEGQVFVMGDNRDSSADSRYGFIGEGQPPAYVPYGNIKGKAMVIWLSLSRDGLGSGLFGGTGLRTDRLFTPVR